MIKLGISSFTFPWMIGASETVSERVSTARSLVLKARELGVDRLQFGDNLPLHHLSRAELIFLTDLAREHSVQIEVGTKRLTQKNIEQYLEIATLFKSPFIRVVIDDADFEPSENEVIDIIQELLPTLKGKNIVLALENHDRFSSTSLVNIIKKTDPEFVAICLDTANSLGAGEGIQEVIRHLATYTVNLHIKDITIARVEHKMGFNIRGCAAGKGALDIPAIIKSIARYQKLHSVTLEVWSDFEDTLEKTMAREQQWAEESIQYLKKIT